MSLHKQGDLPPAPALRRRPTGDSSDAEKATAPTDTPSWMSGLDGNIDTAPPAPLAPALAAVSADTPSPPPSTASTDLTPDTETVESSPAGNTPAGPVPRSPSRSRASSVKPQPAVRNTTPRINVPRRWQSWQFWVYQITFRRYNPGLSRIEELLRLKAQLETEIASNELIDWFVVTVLSIIGGIGKTMMTAYLLHLFGTIRVNDRGVGLDNNPDMGVFAHRMGIPQGSWLPLKEVYERRKELSTYSKTKRLIPFRDGAAVVGAEESDTDFYNTFTREMFDNIVDIFRPLTSGLFGDAGTGLLSTPISKAAIARTNVAVVVADPSNDSKRAALRAHAALVEEGYKDKVANSVLVFNRITSETDDTDLHVYVERDPETNEETRTNLEDFFREVIDVPWDKWMSDRDNPVNLSKISLETHIALLRVLRAVLQGIVAETSSPPALQLGATAPSPPRTEKES